MERLGDTPALVVNHRGDMLAWNVMHAAVFGDPADYPRRDRNVAWLFFTVPEVRARFPEEDHAELVLHTAKPGTETQDRLALLRVVELPQRRPVRPVLACETGP